MERSHPGAAPHAGRVVTKVKQGSWGQADATPRPEEKYKCNLSAQNYAGEGFTCTLLLSTTKRKLNFQR